MQAIVTPTCVTAVCLSFSFSTSAWADMTPFLDVGRRRGLRRDPTLVLAAIRFC